MCRDEVMDEIRKIREDYGKDFDYDLAAMYRDLKKKEKARGHKVVSLPARRIKQPRPKT